MDAGEVIHSARVIFATTSASPGSKQKIGSCACMFIGKTGAGKSTLIETTALQGAERGNDLSSSGPHCDLIARVAARIPTQPGGEGELEPLSLRILGPRGQ